MLSRQQIESRIPHAGAMSLLDRVERWDDTHICCKAAAPAARHPLAGRAGVPSIAAAEYAAQAAAVHGALLEPTDAVRAGMLVKLSDVELFADVFDASGGELQIIAELLSCAASACLYRFEVHDRNACIARGRLMVALQE